MDPEYLRIGNIREDYEHEPRIAINAGLVISPNLVLKMYSMVNVGAKRDGDLVINAKKFLTREINNKRIEPLTGLGFAVLSNGYVNVARWDIVNPIVLKNQVYAYESCDSEFETELLDVSDAGSFCVWELGIVDHEKEAWKRYIQSERSNAEKRTYLDDMVEGEL